MRPCKKKSIKMTKFSEHNFKQKYSSQNTKNGILEDQDFCKILRGKITLRPPLVAHPFRARVIPRLLKNIPILYTQKVGQSEVASLANIWIVVLKQPTILLDEWRHATNGGNSTLVPVILNTLGSDITHQAYRKNLLLCRFQASYAHLDSAKRPGNKGWNSSAWWWKILKCFNSEDETVKLLAEKERTQKMSAAFYRVTTLKTSFGILKLPKNKQTVLKCKDMWALKYFQWLMKKKNWGGPL